MPHNHLQKGTSISWIFSDDAWIYKQITPCKKATIHQVTTMLANSKNVLLPGHNHHARCSGNNRSVRSSVPAVSMVVMTWKQDIFRNASMVVAWWIVAFLHSVSNSINQALRFHKELHNIIQLRWIRAMIVISSKSLSVHARAYCIL